MKKRKYYLPFAVPSLGIGEINEVVDTIKSGWLSLGPKTQLFETQFAQYCQVDHAVAVNSCTAALHLALLAHNIGQNDEVILPSFTFAATANMIVNVGAKPVFADICPDTYCLDPEDVVKRITHRTKAVIPVHFAGHPAEMTKFNQIAKENQLIIIEDAAHAVGAEYQGKKIGSLGNTTCFSFYATKNLCTGEGGMLTTNLGSIAEFININRSHGISKDAWKRYTQGGSWKYQVISTGWKYNLTDIQAAMGIHQLKKLDRFIKIRHQLAQQYNLALNNLRAVITPTEKPGYKHAFHLYSIQTPPGHRDQLIEELAQMNIGASVHFLPLHLMPYYHKRWGYQLGDLPITEAVSSRILSLPLYPSLQISDIDYITSVIKNSLT